MSMPKIIIAVAIILIVLINISFFFLIAVWLIIACTCIFAFSRVFSIKKNLPDCNKHITLDVTRVIILAGVFAVASIGIINMLENWITSLILFLVFWSISAIVLHYWISHIKTKYGPFAFYTEEKKPENTDENNLNQ